MLIIKVRQVFYCKNDKKRNPDRIKEPFDL